MVNVNHAELDRVAHSHDAVRISNMSFSHFGLMEKHVLSDPHVHKSAEIHDVPYRPLKLVASLETLKGAQRRADMSCLWRASQVLLGEPEPLDDVTQSVFTDPEAPGDRALCRRIRNLRSADTNFSEEAKRT